MEKNEEHYVKNMSGKFAREEMKSDVEQERGELQTITHADSIFRFIGIVCCCTGDVFVPQTT
jgi:hypothetical protein